MIDSIGLEQAQDIYNIDVGGTPANVLEKGKIGFLVDRGIKPEQIVMIADPFDLSRVERSLVISDVGNVRRLKFPVRVPGTEKFSSERVSPPTKEEVLQLFQSNRGKILDALYNKYQIFKQVRKKAIAERYNKLQEAVTESAEQSENMRVFMNSLIKILSPLPVQLRYLESVLSTNQDRIYEVLKVRDIEARVFCIGCGRIIPYTFNSNRLEEKVCCSTAETIIEKGSFVPEESMLPTLLYLSGITPCVGKDSSYGTRAIEIIKSLGKFDRPFIMYSRRLDKTMVEYFFLREE